MKSVFSGYRLLALIIITSFIVLACARMSAPTGGPKDVDPPIPLQSKPVNYSTNFDHKKIIVVFDEYISLKNVRQELLISPPLPEKPEVKLRGKSMVVKLNNELEDSMTYNLNFYNAIVDLNEGNPLTNFMFEFSTGSEFDSLYLGGYMKNAFNYTNEAGLYVMLYEQMNDSIPRKTLPNYVAKTNEEGAFFVTNLKNKKYYAIGLKDLNNNLMFDLPNEAIAFSDSAFNPSFELVEHIDSIHYIESISEDLKDTVWNDSIQVHEEWVTTIGDVNLLFFYEDFEQQYFKEHYREEKEQVILAFNRELTDSFSIEPLIDTIIKEDWFVEEPQVKRDSLVYWLTDSVMYNKDSLFFEVKYIRKDSNNIDYLHIDTLITSYLFEDTAKDKKENKKEKGAGLLNINKLFNEKEEEDSIAEVIPSKLTIEHNIGPGFELNKPIDLLSKYPIKTVNPKLIQMQRIEDDTVLIPIDFLFKKDSMRLRHYTIGFNKEEEETFKVMIPAGTFEDIYGNNNDTIQKTIITKSLSEYSTMRLNISEVMDNAKLQLLTANETLIQETTINSDTTILYEYLKPQKLIVKIYYDSNFNDKWDTGNLKERLQPEQVFYFPQELELLKNMDYEYDWNLYSGAK